MTLIDLLRGEVPPPKLRGHSRRHLTDPVEQAREIVLEAARERNRLRRIADPETHREQSRQWAKDNPEKAAARRARWVQNNPERAKKMARAASRRYWRRKHGKEAGPT